MPYEIWAQCPRCEIRADGIDGIEENFGFRKISGKKIPQSFCKKCRK